LQNACDREGISLRFNKTLFQQDHGTFLNRFNCCKVPIAKIQSSIMVQVAFV